MSERKKLGLSFEKAPDAPADQTNPAAPSATDSDELRYEFTNPASIGDDEIPW